MVNFDKNDLRSIGHIFGSYIDRKFGECNGTLDAVLVELNMEYEYFTDLHKKIEDLGEISETEFIEMTTLLQRLSTFNKVINEVLDEADVDMSGEYFDEMLNNMKMMIKNGKFTQMETTENADEELYSFKLTGKFYIASHLKPVFGKGNRQNTVIGFELPDGRMAKLIVGLELATKVNSEFDDYTYITSHQEMKILGFGCLNYSMTSFEKK
jgi:hypothetical protein